MIVFDLRCADNHVFEAWFASGAAYDEQRAAKLLACPICGSGEVEKAVMAPAVGAKGNQQVSPTAMKQMIGTLAAAQAKALSGSEWVGTGFASRARAMHAGDEPHATIHGQATREEARALIHDGVPVAPLPLPVVPPKQVN